MAKKRSPELRLIRVDHVAGEATEDHRVEVRLVIEVEHVENRSGDLVEGRLTRRRAAGMVEIVDTATRILRREGLCPMSTVFPLASVIESSRAPSSVRLRQNGEHRRARVNPSLAC
jgi:hypothetical protein